MGAPRPKGNNQDFIIGIVENGGCKARRDMSIGSIRNAATVSAAVVSLLITACTAPEPVVERVEVTRVVNRNVEVPVTVPVTRIIEQTVEVQVNVPVTQVVEKTVEVTREATREIPVTVLVTPTPPPGHSWAGTNANIAAYRFAVQVVDGSHPGGYAGYVRELRRSSASKSFSSFSPGCT